MILKFVFGLGVGLGVGVLLFSDVKDFGVGEKYED